MDVFLRKGQNGDARVILMTEEGTLKEKERWWSIENDKGKTTSVWERDVNWEEMFYLWMTQWEKVGMYYDL